ncbi:class I SAM-dependent methyltransferase [Acidithiobacillus ferrivorans]|nr:class I SAM-dependent methyltransferase [Acidithiobacillus ferrivorans]
MSTEKEAQQHLYSRLPLDLSAEDSLAKIARRIPHGSTVLDVGCAVGVLGQYLTEQQGCSVDGIEGNAEAAKIAQPFYRRIMVTDLESADLGYLLEGVRYDRIVCADVLEHLRDPGQVLQRLKDHLTSDGKILISIPNIGHVGVFLELLTSKAWTTAFWIPLKPNCDSISGRPNQPIAARATCSTPTERG